MMIARFIEVCRRRSLKVSAYNPRVKMLGGEVDEVSGCVANRSVDRPRECGTDSANECIKKGCLDVGKTRRMVRERK